MNREKKWKDLTWIGFDTETSGKYPVGSELCEIGAIKWQNGKVIDQFQHLVRPRRPMGDAVIAIHGITNEMVAQAPPIEEVIPKFHEFIQGGVLVAHHAQFDLGFITWEFEKLHLGLPAVPVVCSSLLSRRLIPETGNHRLKTLVEYLKIDGGTAHRAFDDARACLEVALYCFNKLGPETTFERIIQQMGVELCWQRFSLADLETNNNGGLLLQAIEQGLELNLAYAGGSRPGKLRRVRPEGIVRNVDGDYLVAQENGQNVAKRYLLAKIQKVSLLTGLN